jgi:hypothetical protein
MHSPESWSEWSPEPRASEHHNETLAHLDELRNLAQGDIAKSMAAHGDTPLLENLKRIRADEHGEVRRFPLPDDPDYSPTKVPSPLSEGQLAAFVDLLGASIARNVHANGK